MCMLVIVAPPIVMGAWSMAFLLGQHVEYYFLCFYQYTGHYNVYVYMYMYIYMYMY